MLSARPTGPTTALSAAVRPPRAQAIGRAALPRSSRRPGLGNDGFIWPRCDGLNWPTAVPHAIGRSGSPDLGRRSRPRLASSSLQRPQPGGLAIALSAAAVLSAARATAPTVRRRPRVGGLVRRRAGLIGSLDA